MIGVFTQDDWEIRRGLTLNLGVRWDKDSLFQGDNNNFAPRVGFAWNLDNSGKTVIRGNTGIFYDTLESSVINRESNFGPQSVRDHDRSSPGRSALSDRSRIVSAHFRPARHRAPCAVYVPIFQGAEFPLSIGDQFHRSRAVFLQHESRRAARAQHQLGPLGRLHARVRLQSAHDVRHQRAAVFRARPGPDPNPGARRSAAAARRSESRRADRTASTSPDFARCISSTTAAARSTTPSSWPDQAAGEAIRLAGQLHARHARGNVDNFRVKNSFVPGLTT